MTSIPQNSLSKSSLTAGLSASKSGEGMQRSWEKAAAYLSGGDGEVGQRIVCNHETSPRIP